MTANEHILQVLAEECSEVAKEVSKSLRFGLDDKVTIDPKGPRGTEGPTNREKIASEMVDLFAVYQMAVARGLVRDLGFCTDHQDVIDQANAKQAKVWAYMGYAQRVGAMDFGK